MWKRHARHASASRSGTASSFPQTCKRNRSFSPPPIHVEHLLVGHAADQCLLEFGVALVCPVGIGGCGQEDMIIPSNFTKDKFVATADDDLVSKGFTVGAKVEVINKITAKFHNAPGGRKDVLPGEILTIKGAVDGKPVIEVEKKDDKGKTMKIDWKVNPDNLALVRGPLRGGPSASAAKETVGKGLRGVPKSMQYLLEGGGQEVVIIQKWNNWQHHMADDFPLNMCQSAVLFTLNKCIAEFPKYTEEDHIYIYIYIEI